MYYVYVRDQSSRSRFLFFFFSCRDVSIDIRKAISSIRDNSRYLKAGGGALCPLVFDKSSLVITVTSSPTAFPKSPKRE